MRKLSVLAIVATLLMCFGCASSGQDPSKTTVENLQKSIIAIHQALYVPTMTVLGQRLDTGHITPAQEARIQAISERYQQAKTAADSVVKLWPMLSNPSALRSALQDMLSAIADLQSQQAQTGGGSALLHRRPLLLPDGQLLLLKETRHAQS